MEISKFVLRIEENINKKIEEIAKKEGRSKTKQIEWILKEYINQYEKKEDKP